MAAVHSERLRDAELGPMLPEHTQLPLVSAERESITRWQRQRKALSRLEELAATADRATAALFRSHGFGHLLPDYAAPRLSRAAG